MLTLPSSDRDLAAEQALLGSLLIDGRAIERVADVVRPDDFDMELHQDMYRAMLDLHRRGRRVDVLLVASALGSQTDEAYLTSLALQVPTSLHVDHYAALVAEQGARGRLSGALTEARRAVEDPAVSFAHARAYVQELLADAPLADRREGRFQLHTDVEIGRLPGPVWLIDGLMPCKGSVVLYGPSGSGKSYLALAWSLCIAAGVPWLDCPVKRGPVVYVAGEGGHGLPGRILAWKQAQAMRAEDVAGVYFLTEAVQFMDEAQVAAFLAAVSSLPEPPQLIVLDTLARCMVGGDENSARDMGIVIAHVERVRQETGATVAILHHTGKNGNGERGSSALRGAVDTMIAVAADGDLVSLTCDKQRDAEPFEGRNLRRGRVDLTDGTHSCVLERSDPTTEAETLHESQRKAVEALALCFDEDGASWTRWQEVSELPPRTFTRAVKALQARGLVEKRGNGRGAQYVRRAAT